MYEADEESKLNGNWNDKHINQGDNDKDSDDESNVYVNDCAAIPPLAQPRIPKPLPRKSVNKSVSASKKHKSPSGGQRNHLPSYEDCLPEGSINSETTIPAPAASPQRIPLSNDLKKCPWYWGEISR